MELKQSVTPRWILKQDPKGPSRSQNKSMFGRLFYGFSQSIPKPHPSKPQPCNMPQAKTEAAFAIFGKLRCRSCTATFAVLQCGSPFLPIVPLQQAKNCTATLQKTALHESGAFLPLSCGFQAPTFRHPRLGPADFRGIV